MGDFGWRDLKSEILLRKIIYNRDQTKVFGEIELLLRVALKKSNIFPKIKQNWIGKWLEDWLARGQQQIF